MYDITSSHPRRLSGCLSSWSLHLSVPAPGVPPGLPASCRDPRDAPPQVKERTACPLLSPVRRHSRTEISEAFPESALFAPGLSTAPAAQPLTANHLRTDKLARNRASDPPVLPRLPT